MPLKAEAYRATWIIGYSHASGISLLKSRDSDEMPHEALKATMYHSARLAWPHKHCLYVMGFDPVCIPMIKDFYHKNKKTTRFAWF